MPGPYAMAGLARSAGEGLRFMGSMLLDAQARQEQRAFREYEIKTAADERRYRREQDEAARIAARQEAQQVAEAAQLAQQRQAAQERAEAVREAQTTVTKLRAEGYDASLGPTRLTGDPMTDEYLAGVPSVQPGEYNFENTPEGQRARYFMDEGYSPTGARPPQPSSPRYQTELTDQGIMVFDPSTGRMGPATNPATGAPLMPPQRGGSAEEELLRSVLGEGQNTPQEPRQTFFGGGEAQAQGRVEPPVPMDETIQALNTAHREGRLSREQHADALARYRAGEVTADQVMGWLTSSGAKGG